jgi:acetoin utilization deacetylase AcuC-like enzyme
MIIYNEDIDLNLKSFGIEIPLLDDRSIKTFKSLLPIAQTPIKSITKLSKEDLLLAHSDDFVERLFSKDLKNELIKCFELIDSDGNFNRYNPDIATSNLESLFDKILLQAGATYLATTVAKNTGFCYSLAGGMHHAMSDLPRGFCLINDLVISARKFQNIYPGSKVAIVDIDVHKGCGSAEITENDLSIETLSIHMKNGWPLDPESGDGPWTIPSTVDIPIALNEESTYLEKLKKGLDKLSNCDLVLIAGGVDPYSEDILESSKGINLSKEQMLERDLLVYMHFKKLNTPQVWTIAGGYGPHSWEIYSNFLKSIREEESF